MLKKIKSCMLVIAFALIFMVFTGLEVNAATINSNETLKECFTGKEVIIEKNTIKLKKDVSFENEIINFSGGEYELELNGYTLSANELYISDGILTIYDDGSSGRINSYFEINNNGKVVINNGNFGNIRNHANLTINYGNFEQIIYNGPKGNLIIEDGNFNAVNQEGIAMITGGVFKCGDGPALNIYIDTAQTTITGGIFETTDDRKEIGAITMSSSNAIQEDAIKKFVGKSSEITYDEFISTTDKYGGNVGLYNNVKIVKVPENYEEKLSKIIPDGKTVTLKSVKPNEPIEVEFYTAGILTQLFDAEGFSVYIDCWQSNSITEGVLTVVDETWKEGSFNKEYPVKIVYEEPEKNEYVDAFMGKLETFNPDVAESYYQVTDLGLINYYMTSNKSELWNAGASSRALKYSDDIIKLSDGGNMQFILDVRAGEQGDGLMYESAFGEMAVLYKGYSYGVKTQGLHLRRVIYIPQDTADTTDAYVAAAQKRINEYLGTNEVTVKYGAPLDTLPNRYEDELVDRSITDGNYYNITIKGKTYKFYIVKGNEEDLAMPTYIGKNIETDITVTTDKSEVPLDTELNVSSVVSEDINKVLGTDNYKAYDIKLFSNGKNSAITKLENGKFLVSIPVGDWLNGKEITAYYINSNNEKEEYATVVKDGIASFETDHFSTYILAEKTNNNLSNPNTSDNILIVVAILMVSMVGIVVGVKSAKI